MFILARALANSEVKDQAYLQSLTHFNESLHYHFHQQQPPTGAKNKQNSLNACMLTVSYKCLSEENMLIS